ncbi:alpha/beta-hydrolase [Hortaea werneckii]|nr:alpha/beta-hydrolase [Hortaea werneckii]KAI6812690.1 alpha/beta-hydrolase [Hortaea werneckii]KAI6913688.1 alpha/beta-hydrolase [Hortaea werneckii]KAI6927601.1 alpha/beta-hydrolase [Hortaea werneckii]KAI6961599.1 alpha/beta-hydrolase [Hortaea werneckii]
MVFRITAAVPFLALLTSSAVAGTPNHWYGPHTASQYGRSSGYSRHYYAPTSASSPTTASCGYQGGEPTATVDAGVLHGTTTSLPAATASVNKFLGVPFAKSPPTRFAPPESPGSFSAPINATTWAPSCIQQFTYPVVQQQFTELIFNTPAAPESEDCLYLNVYAPSTPAPAGGRAVMFWIYGGALEFGNAGQTTYDGSSYASYEDVIVVTTNYRTNVFGFPSSPELPETGHNLGFLDQRFALDWVQRNIAQFGGSPDKVTIFGESAGGFSIDALLTSFPANSTPPFRGAILESGQYSYRPTRSESTSEPWERLSAALGCPGEYSSNLTCLRAANATSIKNTIERQILTFDPIPDGVTLVQSPAQQRLSGNIAYVPVMGGTNAQEGRLFTVGQNNTEAYLTALFSNAPGNTSALVQAVEAAYPLGQNGLNTPYDQIAQVFTEYIFQCPQAKWANDSASIGIPTWRYYYNASFTNTQAFPGLGVYHASEIPLVFGTRQEVGTTTQEYALSNSMMNAWANFAKNPMRGPGWNPVSTGTASQVLVGASSMQTGGQYLSSNGSVLSGTWDLGLWGNRGDVMSGGVTVIDQLEVDYRCQLFEPIYEMIAGTIGMM